MRIHEIITDESLVEQLHFYHSRCTKDCSGHNAGWRWARAHSVKNTNQCKSHSQSFNNGCSIAADQSAKGHTPIAPAIRGAKGKFTKFTPTPPSRKNQ